jgi:hypothetical protein
MAENAVMDKAGELFGKKYFGIPFPVILGGVAVAAFVVRRMVKGQERSEDAAEPTENGYVLDASGNKFASAYTGTGGGVGLPFGSGGLTNASGTGTSPTPVTEINNEGWLRRASEKLTDAGMWDPIFVQTSLAKYVAGVKLNQREQAVASQAVKMEGQPPINVDSSESGDLAATPVPVRIVQNTNGAFVTEYSDGTVRLIRSPAELRALTGQDIVRPGVATSTGLKVDILQENDPFWNIVGTSRWIG